MLRNYVNPVPEIVDPPNILPNFVPIVRDEFNIKRTLLNII